MTTIALSGLCPHCSHWEARSKRAILNTSPLRERSTTRVPTTGTRSRRRRRSSPSIRATSISFSSAMRRQGSGGSVALETCRRGLALAPDHAALALSCGQRYLALRDLERARQELERATSLDEKMRLAWLHLAVVHYLEGDLNRSASAWETTLEMDPDYVLAIPPLDWLYMTYLRSGSEGERLESLRRRELPAPPRLRIAGSSGCLRRASLPRRPHHRRVWSESRIPGRAAEPPHRRRPIPTSGPEVPTRRTREEVALEPRLRSNSRNRKRGQSRARAPSSRSRASRIGHALVRPRPRQRRANRSSAAFIRWSAAMRVLDIGDLRPSALSHVGAGRARIDAQLEKLPDLLEGEAELLRLG